MPLVCPVNFSDACFIALAVCAGGGAPSRWICWSYDGGGVPLMPAAAAELPILGGMPGTGVEMPW